MLSASSTEAKFLATGSAFAGPGISKQLGTQQPPQTLHSFHVSQGARLLPLWSSVIPPGTAGAQPGAGAEETQRTWWQAGLPPSPQVHIPHASRQRAMGKISIGQAWGRNDLQGRFVRGREAGNHFRNQNKRLSHFLLSVPSSYRLAPVLSMPRNSHSHRRYGLPP